MRPPNMDGSRDARDGVAGRLPLLARARDRGARPALVTDAETITYAELEARVIEAASRLGHERRLVLLAGRNHPEAVVLYLAALHGRHPVILADADNAAALDNLIESYDPDVVAGPRADSDRWEITERRPGTRHRLHPDLALLLSTSGSTGSPKLVRLSLANIEANAEAIGAYLGLREDDRAITSLPLAYCYGLSVINSHLARGASIVLTERSVIEPEFWSLFEDTAATSFAGVPYTFDLLDRAGFAELTLPNLRAVTQAGGRMDARTVRRYAELGRRNGWELYVMYGQTEATARMAYLPPALAASRPESIGVPIPGGSLRLDPVPGLPADSGELVYRGANVMLGYAHDPADLALGRTVDELRTGDIGRRASDGLYEVVGRRAEFVKIAGLRVDLRAVERLAERHGAPAAAVGNDDRIVLFTEPHAPVELHNLIRRTLGLPPPSVRIATVAELPRMSNGKLDRRALRELADSLDATSTTDAPAGAPGGVAAVRALYASSLGLDQVADEASFASLGGDSLSYIEVTLGLEEILGRLPRHWASMSVGALGAMAPGTAEPARWWTPITRCRSIEMSVALRAVAILLVVATHIGMIAAPGGAHVLMAVAGYNFARFPLTTAGRTDRLRAQLRAVGRIAIPAMAWVAAVLLLTDEYEIRHMLLINALVRDELWGNLWFIELLVYIGLAMAALLAIPAVDRAERRWPFALAMAVLGIGLLFRFELVDFGVPYTMPVLWLFAIGWAASRAERWWQRALVIGIALVSIPGYFESPGRNALIAAGIGLLVLVPRIRVPGAMARAAGVLAAASLYIYLVHWEVWPLLEGGYGLPSLTASLAAGIVLWMAAARAPGAVDRVRRWAAEAAGSPGTLIRRPSEWRLQ